MKLRTTGSAGKRVLIIVLNLPVPFDRRVWLEPTTLCRAGYEVSVICPKAKGYTASREQIEGIDVLRYHLPGDAKSALGFVFEFAWCFLRTLMLSVRVATRGRGFDVIHACNPPDTYWLLARLWRPLGKRFLFDHHDLAPEMFVAKDGSKNGILFRALCRLELATFRTADVVITTNESHKRIAVERGGLSPRDVYVVRSGPDVDRLQRYEPDPSYRNGRRHLLVYLGEICEQDGVDHLVRVMRILRDDLGRDDVQCLFVGGGPHQPMIRAYAEEAGVRDHCTFLGRVSDDILCRALSSADIGVDPDPKNDWSDKSTMNKIMEYMFFGLPVASYDLTENRVSAQDAGVYAEPNDECALARIISDLLDDDEARRRMSAYGAQRLRDALSWQHSIEPLLEAYGRVTREGPDRVVA